MNNAAARQAGDDGAMRGMTRAVEHADKKVPRWSDMAFEYVMDWLALTDSGSELIAPELREWCYEHGLPRPPSEQSWGWVIKRAKKAGLIVHGGFTTYGDTKMHTQSIMVWRKA